MAKNNQKNETSLPLEKMIPSYGKLKAQISEDDKAAKLLNSRIKAAMLEQNITEKEAGGFIAKYSTRITESFNESQLLEFCRDNKELRSFIKTAEYVDMDQLENLIYDKKVSKKLLLEMDKLRIKKETEYLTISKTKTGE